MNKDYFEGWTVPVEPRQTLQNERRTTLQPIPPLYIKTKVEAVFGADSAMALRIIACESGFNPKAINWDDAKITGMPSQGLFQINAPYNEILFNIEHNVSVAYEMFLRRGWQPWTCAKKLGILE